MADALFPTLDAGGTVPPLLGVAAEVSRRGHQVRVLGHEQQRAAVEAAGLEFHPYRDTEWDPRGDQSTIRGLRERLDSMKLDFRDLNYEDVAWSKNRGNASALVGFWFPRSVAGADLVELLSPDTVVVADCILLNLLSAAQGAGHPTVALVHSFHAYFDGPWRHGPIGLLAAMKGLRSRRIWGDCDAVLVCTDRALDPASPPACGRSATSDTPRVPHPLRRPARR